jgi:hypothetical protein|tara:strand:- start:176 stop:280 length:105 start_codon:yes stop_codon:yes gene_type:complete
MIQLQRLFLCQLNNPAPVIPGGNAEQRKGILLNL